ncbi:unnamed protein product [Rotaria sp. Silwood1]|nr:unnamed protein product [Rotaria sp. Silwood1]
MSDESHDIRMLNDVCQLSLGIEDIHGHMHIFIRRNTNVPTQTELCTIFTNAYAYQTTAIIRIYEGEHTLTKYNTFLGEFSLPGLSNNFASQTLEIGIRMDVDKYGILRINAEEMRSGAKASFTIDWSRQKKFTRDEFRQHIQYVHSDPNFTAKSSKT